MDGHNLAPFKLAPPIPGAGNGAQQVRFLGVRLDGVDVARWHDSRSAIAVLDRTWPHAHGARLGLAKLAIDTGYETPAVYAWARKVGHGQVVPVKGIEGFNRAAPVIGPTFVDVTEAGRKLRRGARLGDGSDLAPRPRRSGSWNRSSC